MALIRMNIFFAMTGTGSRSAGWSETHYSKTAQTLAGALVNLRALAILRSNLLGAGVTVKYFRVSDDEVFRDVGTEGGLNPLVGPHGPYYYAAFRDDPSDFAYSVALVKMIGDDPIYFRTMYLSGAPDLDQDIEHPVPTSAGWNQQFALWKNELLSGKYGFKVLDRSPGNAPIAITSLVDGTFSTAPVNHGLNPNQFVNITRFRPGAIADARCPNGRRQVATAPTLTTFTLRNYIQFGYTPTTMGQLRKLVFRISEYKQVLISGMGSRRRGRPFGLPVGRRRRPARSS